MVAPSQRNAEAKSSHLDRQMDRGACSTTHVKDRVIHIPIL